MYPENARIVDNLVRDMTELPILHVGKLGNFVVGFWGKKMGNWLVLGNAFGDDVNFRWKVEKFISNLFIF